jgi:membrane-associated phospholipid phosphatase
MALIMISVLTTYQHHLVDVASGLAVGMATVYAIPSKRG